jgi:hypothetical protein
LDDDAGRFDEDIAHGRLCSAIEAARPYAVVKRVYPINDNPFSPDIDAARPREGADDQGVPWCRICPDGTCHGERKLTACDVRAGAKKAEIPRVWSQLEIDSLTSVCWHCGDVLIGLGAHCEHCPAPGDCDYEECELCAERKAASR